MRQRTLQIVAIVFVVLLTTPSVSAVRAANPTETFPPPAAKTILFLGDSITYAGNYVALIDAHLRLTRRDSPLLVLNLGLPSETCTGLSEPAHPFPRPNVHERLDRALKRVQPDIVVACYGMNDGIYAPFDEDRFVAYQQGIRQLISKVDATGAPLVLLTPPPFDPLPLSRANKLRPADAAEHDWRTPYEHYDRDVISRYAQWIKTLADDVHLVVDLHTPIAEYVAKQRESDPDFSLSPDGVHLDVHGHARVAAAILDAWGHEFIPDLEIGYSYEVYRRSILLRDAWLAHVEHQRPGIAGGMRLDEANERAAEFDVRIDALIPSN